MTLRSKEYLAFVRSKGCLVCGRPSDAHHAIGRRGVGLKPSDYGTVPLCRVHHTDIHRLGKDSFQEEHSIDLAESVANLLHEFYTGQPLSMVLI